MSLQLTEIIGSNILTINVSGKLEKADYEQFIPELERLIWQHGKLQILFDMRAFHGWEASAVWEDFKFGMQHFTAIERLAMVGEERWQHGMAIFIKPFTMAAVRYFDHPDLAQARAWLAEGQEGNLYEI